MENTNRENYKEQSWHCQQLYRYRLLLFGLIYLRCSIAGQLESITVWHFIKCTVLIAFVFKMTYYNHHLLMSKSGELLIKRIYFSQEQHIFKGTSVSLVVVLWGEGIKPVLLKVEEFLNCFKMPVESNSFAGINWMGLTEFFSSEKMFKKKKCKFVKLGFLWRWPSFLASEDMLRCGMILSFSHRVLWSSCFLHDILSWFFFFFLV